MKRVWKRAIELGMERVPQRIAEHEGWLRYKYHDDVADDFLRRYLGLAKQLFNAERFAEAQEVFGHLLELDPLDGIHARYLAMNCAFELGRSAGVIAIWQRYEDDFERDSLLHMSYALAAWECYPEDQARAIMEEVVGGYPAVAKVVARKNAKERYPERGYYSRNTVEEGYIYWNLAGKYWRARPEARAMMHEAYTKVARRAARKRSPSETPRGSASQ